MNTREIMAILTPLSATARAGRAKVACSVAWSPNSFTSSAPETEKRSVIVADISACSCMRSRDRSASCDPIRLAGTMNTGSRTSAASVSGHDSASIDASTSTSVTALDTSVDSVDVNACWAPVTSDWSRETSLPVCEREKNASGIRITWS